MSPGVKPAALSVCCVSRSETSSPECVLCPQASGPSRGRWCAVPVGSCPWTPSRLLGGVYRSRSAPPSTWEPPRVSTGLTALPRPFLPPRLPRPFLPAPSCPPLYARPFMPRPALSCFHIPDWEERFPWSLLYQQWLICKCCISKRLLLGLG